MCRAIARSGTPRASCASRVRDHRAQHVGARARRRIVAEQTPVGLREQIRVVVRGAAEHHAVDVRELALDRVAVGEARR